jgi:hypothetical protein
MSVHFSASGKNLEMVSYARLPSVLGKDQDQPLPNKISLEYKLYALCTVPLVYIVIRSFAPNPIGLLQMHCDFQLGSDGDLEPTTVDTGMCVCPRKTICATSGFELFMLAMSRGSTYFAYPFYILIFLTKANNLNHAMNKAFISQFVPITSSHHVHQLGGFVIGIATLFHSFWHLLRWGLSGHMRSLITTQTGITGTICCILTFVIVWPMLLEPIRKVMSFEWRKGLHMLSWIWGISLALHAPATHVGAIIGNVTCLEL